MRQKMRWRYYCDFCNKAGGHRRHMETHEKHCTMNPERKCRVCSVIMQEVQPSMEELKAALMVSFTELREVAHECPACILAADRQLPYEERPGWDGFLLHSDDDRRDWDYKKAMESLMKEFYEERHREYVEMVGYGGY